MGDRYFHGIGGGCIGGGNNIIIMSGSDSEGNHPPKRRPQGTFVHAHGRPEIANRRATKQRSLNEDELVARLTTDESSEMMERKMMLSFLWSRGLGRRLMMGWMMRSLRGGWLLMGGGLMPRRR